MQNKQRELKMNKAPVGKWRGTEVFVRDSTRVQCFSRQTFKLCKTVEKKTMLDARFAGQLIQFGKIARLNTKCDDGNVVCFQFFRYWQRILTIREAIGDEANDFFAMTPSLCQNILEKINTRWEGKSLNKTKLPTNERDKVNLCLFQSISCVSSASREFNCWHLKVEQFAFVVVDIGHRYMIHSSHLHLKQNSKFIKPILYAEQ